MFIEYMQSIGLEIEDIEEQIDTYDPSVIQSIEINNMKEIVTYLKQNHFSTGFIQDIIKVNLEIFTYPATYIEENLEYIKKKNPNNYIEIITETPELLYIKE